MLSFNYLMFPNSYKLDFFFLLCKAHSFPELPCTDPHVGVSALKCTCQIARLVIHKLFLLFTISASAPMYFVSEKEVKCFLR